LARLARDETFSRGSHRVGADIVDLSAREFALAEAFLRHPGQVLAREQLLSQVWDERVLIRPPAGDYSGV
jgi:DNA-binding response OmpR family regulator